VQEAFVTELTRPFGGTQHQVQIVAWQVHALDVMTLPLSVV
jgi:hypothetical protein